MAEPSGLSPREFLDKLRSGALAAPVEVVGMVREIEGNDDALEFSVDCGSWISIPLKMIQSIDSLGAAPCKDHTHHSARIRLNESQSDEATVFAKLLAGHSNNRSAMSRSIAPMPVDPEVIRCRRECYSTYSDWDERQRCLEGCVPLDNWLDPVSYARDPQCVFCRRDCYRHYRGAALRDCLDNCPCDPPDDRWRMRLR
ncbi:hypothetical protein J3E61_004519 [Mycobacterium sp. OAE908]